MKFRFMSVSAFEHRKIAGMSMAEIPQTSARYYVWSISGDPVLGYIERSQPGWFHILRRFEHEPRDPFPIRPEQMNQLGEATKEDFERFRISWKGHLE